MKYLARRTFLKGGAMALGATVLPMSVMADWPKAAFEAKTMEDAMQALYKGSKPVDSGDILLKAPQIAENGAVVPIQISTSLPNVESISIIIEKNPGPLAARFNLGKDAEPNISTRVKMSETSNVVAVVKSDGKLYTARQEVKVTIGGCGG